MSTRGPSGHIFICALFPEGGGPPMRKEMGGLMRRWGIGLGLLGLAWSASLSAQEVPPSTGLVAYWTLNDAGDPTAVETSGSAPQNDGTYVGTSLPTTSSS